MGRPDGRADRAARLGWAWEKELRSRLALAQTQIRKKRYDQAAQTIAFALDQVDAWLETREGVSSGEASHGAAAPDAPQVE